MESLKQKLGQAAAKKVVDGMVIGLGTGSTTDFFTHALGERFQKQELMNTKFVCSSYSTILLAQKYDLPTIDLSEVSQVDLYVDGADEVDSSKNLIKGRGAAMVREKVLAQMAKSFLVLVDESKKVEQLNSKFLLPVEFLPVALESVKSEFIKLNGTPKLRFAKQKDGPVVTDQGLFIFDVQFSDIQNTQKFWVSLDQKMNSIPGVLGHGLFLSDLVSEVWMAYENGEIITKN